MKVLYSLNKNFQGNKDLLDNEIAEFLCVLIQK